MRPDDTPELPPELIDLIMDNLSSSDDEDTLKACSIVSSSFRDSAQKRLFSSIDIHTSPAAAHRNNRLFEVLASNPQSQPLPNEPLSYQHPTLLLVSTKPEVSLPFGMKGMDGERGYLRDLSVYESYISDQIQSVLDHPDSRLSLSRLRTYSNQLISDDTDHDYSQAILQLSSSSLEEVQLEYVQLMSEPYPDLSQLHNLRVLRLHTNNLDTPLVAIHALGTVACSNALSEVYLQVDAPLSWSGPDRDEWRQLDEVLARERHALHLQLLHLDVDTPIMRMDEDWEYHVRDAMPKLSSAGRLHFGDFQGAPPLQCCAILFCSKWHRPFSAPIAFSLSFFTCNTHPACSPAGTLATQEKHFAYFHDTNPHRSRTSTNVLVNIPSLSQLHVLELFIAQTFFKVDSTCTMVTAWQTLPSIGGRGWLTPPAKARALSVAGDRTPGGRHSTKSSKEVWIYVYGGFPARSYGNHVVDIRRMNRKRTKEPMITSRK
ncbi:hypothetical protein LshimejAT787_0400580 [Lyophyllum shimeji]|uniref:F-box domain-containing protein n=1 Tax=Lyophyllum shimeji TaxID=47721 RepID=A0A9P3PKI9_LYOSH|nr:hypothetical protein LshimejAT787_0400580 [Lyophyllum shimeji]